MPGFHNFYQNSKDKNPIFFNFYGDTPLTIALKFQDYQSFYLLVDTLLKY